MVKSVLGVKHQGFSEWLIQRVTAVLMTIYTVGLLVFIVVNPNLDYSTWYNLFSNTWMKLATLIILIGLLYHAWIGMWTVFTDYIKCFVVRLFIEVIVLLALVACFFAGLLILWGV